MAKMQLKVVEIIPRGRQPIYPVKPMDILHWSAQHTGQTRP